MSAYSKLRVRARRFVDAYVELGDGAKAMRRLKFKGKRPDQAAYKLLQRPEVRAAIAERDAQAKANAGLTRTRTLIELRRVAYFDPRALQDKRGNPIPLHKLSDDVAAGIAGIDVEELFVGRGESRVQTGELKKYRYWNKVEALKLAMQLEGDLIERHEHAGPNGGAIPVKDTTELSELDLARRVAFVLARGLRASAATPDPAIPPDDSTST